MLRHRHTPSPTRTRRHALREQVPKFSYEIPRWQMHSKEVRSSAPKGRGDELAKERPQAQERVMGRALTGEVLVSLRLHRSKIYRCPNIYCELQQCRPCSQRAFAKRSAPRLPRWLHFLAAASLLALQETVTTFLYWEELAQLCHLRLGY